MGNPTVKLKNLNSVMLIAPFGVKIKEEKQMKRKVIALVLSAILCFSMAACGETSGVESKNTAPNSIGSSQPEEPVAPDLAGEWKQVNSKSEDSYQTATIQGDTIEVYWVTASDDTKALYWAGSFISPETADEPYVWQSENDTEKTSSALLASGDATKTFTYQDGQISYDVSAMGMTQTVKLEKQ